MPASSSFSGFLDHLFPEASPRVRALYARAADRAGLLPTDFYTIRDLLDLSGYAAEEPLHVLLLCLVLALDEGSLCVEASAPALIRRLSWLVPSAEAADLASGAVKNLADYPRLIGQQVNDGKPLILYPHETKRLLFFQRYLKHELLLQEQLRLRLQKRPVEADIPGLRSVLEDVLQRQPMLRNGQPIQLNRDQRLALAVALLQPFTIISGGPGTGKTSIVFTLLRCLVRCGLAVDQLALAAPTGRAAQRLTDAVRSGLEGLPAFARQDGPDAVLRQLQAATVHHLLGYQPARGTFRHHRENLLPFDVVIVDEVSMVGLFLMAQLLQATAPQTKLILLGDKDQLPSVEAGAVLASLVPADGNPGYSELLRSALAELWPDLGSLPTGRPQPLQDVLVILEQNYRSQRNILEVAAAINQQRSEIVDQLRCLAWGPQDVPLPSRERQRHRRRADSSRTLQAAENKACTVFADLEKQPGCWLLDQETLDVTAWRQVLQAWLTHHYLTAAQGSESYRGLVEACRLPEDHAFSTAQRGQLDRLFALLNRARVLTLVRDGPFGCTGINQFLEQQLRLRLDRQARGSLFLGAPVLVTRNDYSRELFNGDVGIALRSGGGYRVVFPRQGQYVAYPSEALPAHELAFALTVHKSQGSEYEQVLLVVPPDGGERLLTKEMIYTGITRAKQLAIICAKKETLRLAIRRRVEREAGLLTL